MRYLLSFHLLLFLVCPATASVQDELAIGLSTAPGTTLQYLFEVTFMKIDVAEVEAFLPTEDVSSVQAMASGKEYSDESAKPIRDQILQADRLLVCLEFLRDAGLKRLLGGTKDNMEAAQKADLISETEFKAIISDLERDFSPIEERGLKKGDQLHYRVEGDSVRTVYTDNRGEILLDFSHRGPDRALGLKGSFFSKGSSFSKGLIRSVFRQD